tara:strand:- start:171 stop:512 length:342 start_codon:yes stop_codon:yes gene_type:complete
MTPNPSKRNLPEFEYVENPKEPDHHAIKINSGPYRGIIYTYGVVGFEENEEQDNLQISFSYDIMDNSRKVDVLEDKEFHDIMGNILTIILKYNMREENAGKYRENDTNQSGKE